MRPVLCTLLAALLVSALAFGEPAGTPRNRCGFTGDTADFTNVPLLKAAVVDAGVLNVEGQTTIKGQLYITGLSGQGLNFTDGNGASRTSYGNGRYFQWTVNGRMGFTGGNDGVSVGSIGIGTSDKLTDSATAPTIANSCTGEAVTWHNGTTNFRFDVGTSCTGVTSTVITLPAVSTCWTCECFDIVNDATLQQSFGGCSTTTFTVSNRTRLTTTATDYTDGADIQCKCRGG